MKSILLFLSFELLSICQVMAQNVKGKIVDGTGKPLSFANVVLLNRQDSSFVKGTISGNDGGFLIETSCVNGIIKVSSVGYKTTFNPNRSLENFAFFLSMNRIEKAYCVSIQMLLRWYNLL